MEVLDVSEAKLRGNGVKRFGDPVVGRCTDEWVMWIELKVEGIWAMVVQV